MLVRLCVFVCVWGGICPPRLRPSMNSGWLSHLLVKSPWWTKIGAVTNHDVMHRLGLIVVIPLLNRLPGILFRGSPPRGHQKSKISCSGRGNASKRTQKWCLGESSDKQSLSREVQKVFFFESNEVCTSSIPLFHSSHPQEL